MIESGIFTYERPWSIDYHDGRVYISSANGMVVTEILPGQKLGVPPSIEVRTAIAKAIVDHVNSVTD